MIAKQKVSSESIVDSKNVIYNVKLGKVYVKSGAILLFGDIADKVKSVKDKIEEKYDVVVRFKSISGVPCTVIIPRVVIFAKKGKADVSLVRSWFRTNLSKLLDELGNEMKIWEIKPVPSFLKFLENHHKPAYDLYSASFKSYVKWLEHEKGLYKSTSDLTLEDLKPSWIDEFIKSIRNPYTANSYLYAFKSLFKFVQKEYVPRNFEEFAYLSQYMKGIDSVKDREVPKYYSKESLTVDELSRLLEACEDDEDLFSATVVHFYFGARPVELAYDFAELDINLSNIYDLVKEHGRRMVDFEKSMVCLPTAKSETRIRIIPIDPIKDHFRRWLKLVRSEIENYCRPRYWFTNHIKSVGKNIGIKVTAKTARKTFETHMSMQNVKQWQIDYWLGHSTTIPDKYRDFNTLLPFIKETMVSVNPAVTALRELGYAVSLVI